MLNQLQAESINTNNLENEFNNGLLIAQPAVDTGATDGEYEDGDLDPRSEELDSGNVDLRPNDEGYREESGLDSYEEYDPTMNREDMNREYEEGYGEGYDQNLEEDIDEGMYYIQPHREINDNY
ncbi:hypothetical protein ACL6C3_30510 [Capilliphycus salinus ALCB114379]|uniref:hypothetical protein n=1 Tax=Capilliphycus salinus TaxID=2768948 RepID=UPI0039A7046E